MNKSFRQHSRKIGCHLWKSEDTSHWVTRYRLPSIFSILKSKLCLLHVRVYPLSRKFILFFWNWPSFTLAVLTYMAINISELKNQDTTENFAWNIRMLLFIYTPYILELNTRNTSQVCCGGEGGNQTHHARHHLSTKTKLRGFSPPANYTDRATAACRRS
jgi:hypothetical protein